LAACWAVAQWTTAPNRVVLGILSAIAAGMLLGGKAFALVLIGGYVLTDLLWNIWRDRDRDGLFLVLWLLVPVPIIYYGHLPIKYLLPCLPAVILLCFKLSSGVPVQIARIASVFAIIGGTAYSLLILRADAEFADFGRDTLNALIRPHVLAGEKVWFPNEASSYWYAPLAGAQLALPGTGEPQRGDLLVVGIREVAPIMQKLPNRTLLQVVTHKYRFGRTMFGGAGFYTNNLGNWLWTPGGNEIDRFELWKIDPMALRGLHP